MTTFTLNIKANVSIVRSGSGGLRLSCDRDQVCGSVGGGLVSRLDEA